MLRQPTLRQALRQTLLGALSARACADGIGMSSVPGCTLHINAQKEVTDGIKAVVRKFHLSCYL